MTFKKLLVAACALLLITACTHKSGTGSAYGSENTAAMEELQRVGDRVFFEYDSSALSPQAKETLHKQAEFLKAHSNLNIIMEGHADERGTREYNIGLGERRASAAKRFLETCGLSGNIVKIVSYGKERPAVLGHDEAAYSQNRRAVTVIE